MNGDCNKNDNDGGAEQHTRNRQKRKRKRAHSKTPLSSRSRRRAFYERNGKQRDRNASELHQAERGRSARRRDSRINGADIYVARVVKQGLGSARPCWRCVKWCYWSGVKRIFHWNADEGRFDVIKVNDLEGDCYETQADTRLFAGSCY